MIRYKLVGGSYPSFTRGNIYTENSKGDYSKANFTVREYARDNPHYWEKIEIMENYMMIDGVKIPLSEETIESIRNSKKEVTLRDILASRKNVDVLYYVSAATNGKIKREYNIAAYHRYINHYTNKQRPEQLQAIGLMMIVADYLNDEELVYCNNQGAKYIIGYNTSTNNLFITSYELITYNAVVFSTKDKAELALKILGKNTIKLALTGQGNFTNHNLDIL